jgi:hypothetical protein
MKSILAIAVALTTVMTLAAFPTLVGIKTQAQTATQLPANIGNNTNPVGGATNENDHLPVHTVQDDNYIVTTITKQGKAPEGPIVVIPGPGGSENGTIIAPGNNSTNENVTVITPGGNVTELPGNVTNVGNDTVIVAPPDRNVTETPGNVTVISPPLGNENQTTVPAPCTCNQTQPPATIPPVLITPAPGQNVTTNPPVVEQPGGSHGNETFPANNATQPNPPAGAGNNQTGNTGGNETQTNPANNNTNTATQLPASATVTSPFLPGYNIHNISYKGVNNDFLNK